MGQPQHHAPRAESTTAVDDASGVDHRRRRLLAAGAVSAAAWAAPAVLRVDRAVAGPGSCVDNSVQWSGLTQAGNVYTATGSSGGLTITAVIQAFLRRRARPQVFLSGGQVVIAMSRHRVGEQWTIDLSFGSTVGPICTATTTLLDIDQNGRGLGCATNSRFRDEITSLYGPGLIAVPQGGLAQVPLDPGTWASSLPCKTTNTENLGLTWVDAAGVAGGGFVWRAGIPPGTSQRLDRQLIIMTPMTLCVAGTATGSPSALEPTLSSPNASGLADASFAVDD